MSETDPGLLAEIQRIQQLMNIGSAKFELGQVVTTPLAEERATKPRLCNTLARHVAGFWGLLGTDDARKQDAMLKDNDHSYLMSVWPLGDGDPERDVFWILTEALGPGERVTTIFLPEER